MTKLTWRLSREDLAAGLALVYTAALLTALEYWYLPSRIQMRLNPSGSASWSGISLEAGVTWSLACIAGYMVLPLLIVLCVHRAHPLDAGWRFRGIARHLLVYLGLYVLMVPAVYWASRQQAFLHTYPFVRAAAGNLDTFLRWELAYVAQFFALESFFRGYLLFTLEKRFGQLSIFMMAVPYCMIHYHKPPAEAFGALAAGLILGALALRYRSWLGGAILHSLVAVTMDSLAAHEAGLF